VTGEIGGGAGRNSNRASAYCNMWGGHSDHIDKQRHRQNRTAAPNQSKNKTNDTAASYCQQIV
jgi:putative hemolysin